MVSQGFKVAFLLFLNKHQVLSTVPEAYRSVLAHRHGKTGVGQYGQRPHRGLVAGQGEDLLESVFCV
jgi:hypothetical protein